jgi:hypothetical protein
MSEVPKLPKELEAIADIVLAYKPRAAKARAAKTRKKTAKKKKIQSSGSLTITALAPIGINSKGHKVNG